jgi:hypothetical protein
MGRKHWIIAALLAVVFGGLLVYGVFKGDIQYVLLNAQSFCFS